MVRSFGQKGGGNAALETQQLLFAPEADPIIYVGINR